jgi:hypothetical protein
MRSLGFVIGVILLLCAAATGVAQIFAYVAHQSSQTIALGGIWYSINGNSLVGFQALVEKRLSPDLWPPILTLLTSPAWLVLGVPGLILALLCRPRRRRLDAY